MSFAVLAGAAAAMAIFMLATNLPSVFNLIAAVAAVVNAGAYWGLPLYDEAVHTYTGFAVSSVFG